MWFRKLAPRIVDVEAELDDFDSREFIRKMLGEDLPRQVDWDKKYKMSDFSRMLKTMLISLEILAERLNKETS